MQRSTDVLERLEALGLSLADGARQLGLNPNALAKAKADAKLSPAIAAGVAGLVGANEAEATFLAAAESNRTPPWPIARSSAILPAAGWSTVAGAPTCRDPTQVPRIHAQLAPKVRPAEACIAQPQHVPTVHAGFQPEPHAPIHRRQAPRRASFKDHGAFELGDQAEHLNHRTTDRRARVDRLRQAP
jgi:hypothetical protein